jgi:hypothetical protein
VFCQLDALKRCKKSSTLLKALESLPKTLDDTYARILTNIEEGYQQEARRALIWLAFSQRPLCIEEVAEAAIVDAKLSPPFDLEERLHDPCNDILEILGSLVTISSKIVSSNASGDISSSVWNRAPDDPDGDLLSDEVRLAHFSVKEYLLSDRIQSSSASKFGATSIEADHFISESSLLYILHYDESNSKTTSPEDLEFFPLLQYACQFWYTHSKSIPVGSRKSIDPITFRLFLSDTALVTWLQVHRPDNPMQKPFSFSEDVGSPLYYASDIGLEAVVRQLLEHEADVNAKDKYGSTALYRAAKNGHGAVVKLLLEHKADVNAKDNYGSIPLCRAAENGHDAVVKLLLEHKADVNAKSWSGWTALYWAAKNGHQAVVKLLVEHEADVNAKDNYGSTALYQAAENGHEAVVKLLLEHKADFNAEDNCGLTALHRAQSSQSSSLNQPISWMAGLG